MGKAYQLRRRNQSLFASAPDVRFAPDNDHKADMPRGRICANRRHGLHSITLSARATSNGGSSIPRVFAVFRLMLNSNLVGWKMGMSPGLAPLSILSAKSATRCP